MSTSGRKACRFRTTRTTSDSRRWPRAIPTRSPTPALSEHVASCLRCTDTVAELGALRAALAEMPDLQPHRPLQLLPPVEDAPTRVDRARWLGTPLLRTDAHRRRRTSRSSDWWARRPHLSSGHDGHAVCERRGEPGWSSARTRSLGQPSPVRGGGAVEPSAGAGQATNDAAGEEREDHQPLRSGAEAPAGDGTDASSQRLLDEGRPIWPRLLFAGVAIMISAALLRWILASRAG